MTTRCCCYNCGHISSYELPYRARIVEDGDEGAVMEGSYTVLDNGTVTPFLCDNCGHAMLQVVFWSEKKVTDPLQSVRLARG